MKPAPGQLNMFAPPRTAREQYDASMAPEIDLNSTVEEQDIPRLSAQHHAILARLKEGPVTNLDLGMICQRFGARLNELKKAGYQWKRTNIKPGVNEYRLIGE